MTLCLARSNRRDFENDSEGQHVAIVARVLAVIERAAQRSRTKNQPIVHNASDHVRDFIHCDASCLCANRMG